mmetsp:Transcript_2279/g.2971  ORF Transcript_2279/g.2971 Transcript_2279/m.2971 type:complete len:355 (-) Transcript_2279:1884-2948(-)|eukprot:CAMPEP_0197289580 /NCGR_PEP_ID=MMETSP0890-20130614/6840_1 /TAXON_ID=44058 ORGANISM="Aureoumbra lagunensis, Strain CCMP1510" /NCGR_SAMPLE_ID=MMETSP0890 /ASSEMBLY_ACC=CAM_ASM_000533 /LENGTH=354 /DNA_ID=CAMNT_0042761067 /DNA_START=67 /DNA_END=1131 /DNA_ORIENTATION=+
MEQVSCKIRQGKKWKDAFIECAEEPPLIRVNGEELALLRVYTNKDKFELRLSVCEFSAFKRAHKAMVVPRATRVIEIQVDSIDKAEKVEAMRKAKRIQTPQVGTLIQTRENKNDNNQAQEQQPTQQQQERRLESLEARFEKLRVDEARQRLDDLKGVKPVPHLDTLKERFAALRDGDVSGPVFKKYSASQFESDDDEDDILAWARDQADGSGRDPDLDAIIDSLTTEDANVIWNDNNPPRPIDTRNILHEAQSLREEAKDTIQKASTQEAVDSSKQPSMSTAKESSSKKINHFPTFFTSSQQPANTIGYTYSTASSSPSSSDDCDYSSNDDDDRETKKKKNLQHEQRRRKGRQR